MNKILLIFLSFLFVSRAMYAQKQIKLNMASQQEQEQAGVIMERPAGVVHSNLYRMSNSYFDAYYYVGQQTSDGGVGEYVVDAEGNIYVKNPIWLARTNSYVKLDKQADGTYLFKGHQPITVNQNSDGSTSTYYIEKMSWEYDEENWEYTLVKASEDQNRMVFHFDGDTLRTDDNSVLGITDAAGNWLKYGDNYITLFPQKDEKITVPADADFTDYHVVYQNDNVKNVSAIVKLAEDGNNVYIKGFDKNIKDGVIKGTKKDGKVIFTRGQYLGIDTVEQAHIYFSPAVAYKSYSSVYKKLIVDSIRIKGDGLIFTAEKGGLKTDSASAILFNSGIHYYRPVASYINPYFTSVVSYSY